jgi:hypothetical protein
MGVQPRGEEDGIGPDQLEGTRPFGRAARASGTPSTGAGARVTVSEARPMTRSWLHLGSLPAAVRGAFARIKVSVS